MGPRSVDLLVIHSKPAWWTIVTTLGLGPTDEPWIGRSSQASRPPSPGDELRSVVLHTIMPPCSANTRNADARNANAVPLVETMSLGSRLCSAKSAIVSRVEGVMDISRLMTHAQEIEGDKLRELAKDNKKARIGNYEYSEQKSDSGNRSQFQ
ncbi:hypothetical protein MTR67_023470 [Solanum verrucosum]|uniref:Uncharacterized protein n=1 Tax=Solanum verrucosum TaxID=315347 RepID=A0AAF0TXN4_SOLVR|nr:hypothetical protein MTR67_023470 [Solanum verrucosum]